MHFRAILDLNQAKQTFSMTKKPKKLLKTSFLFASQVHAAKMEIMQKDWHEFCISEKKNYLCRVRFTNIYH